jgi:hypothetical protein
VQQNYESIVLRSTFGIVKTKIPDLRIIMCD